MKNEGTKGRNITEKGESIKLLRLFVWTGKPLKEIKW